MTFRPGPLRAAAVLAAGFVVVRVVYRVLFHGADGVGTVLVPLPELRLPPPFAHVVMLGPVTTDGLWDAAASALPIALGILAFGLVNSIVDVARLLARASRRGPLRGLARALAIAWATLPSLADGARAVRFAQRLRRERGGVRMLMPLLQRTLERAGNVAAALELRGFAGRGLDGECRAAVEAHGVELGYGAMPDAAAAAAIHVPSLALEPGSLTLLSGPTGSGKSTLLRAIAGLHEHVDGGWATGSLRVVGHDRGAVPPRDLAQRAGVVLQHPRDAFVTERVRDEIGLALELRGVAPVIAGARVAEVAARAGIAELLHRPTRGLSAGEATLVAIAAAIVEHPILLLVDEPLADLDADARTRIAELLDRLAHEAGMCVLVAEHRVEPLAPLADRRLRIEGRTVVEVLAGAGAEPRPGLGLTARLAPTGESAIGGWSEAEAGLEAAARLAPAADVRAWRSARPAAHGDGSGQSAEDRGTAARPADAATPRVLRAEGLTVRHRDLVAVDGAALELFGGEVVALVGPNGAGKSSLLTALALPGRGARVEASGPVALVPDASDDLFVYDTVAAECRRADRRAAKAGRRAAKEGRRASRLLRTQELPRNEEHSPRFAPHFGESPHSRVPRRGTAARFAEFLGLDPDGPEITARLARHPRDLSVGERRCLALAIQLAGDPAAVLVDEPTRGLDPAARAVVWRALRGLADGGAAVLVASHEPEVTALADRAVWMESGVLGAYRAQEEPVPARRAPRDSATAPSKVLVAPENGTGRPPTPRRRSRAPRASLTLAVANLVALAAFCWPLVASAVPAQAYAAVPVAALALAPLAALVVVATLDDTVRSAHLLALLGTLAATGAAVRIASTGVGGVEAVFILLILAGRAFGPRFGLLLGMATIALSTLVTGTFGPWTPFQMFACAWVGAIAGLLPRRIGAAAEIAMLCVYGVVASYAFGLLMNLWFWPFAVGYGTGISYVPGGSVGTNLTSFVLYSLVTSTLTWDTLRAITSVIGILVIGRPVLAALRRAKPLQLPGPRRTEASARAVVLQP